MKTPLIIIACSAACFAAGYWTRSVGVGTDHAEGKGGPVSSAMAARAGQIAAKESAATGAEKEVRAFTPGRPFAKGKAKEWLLSLAADLKDNGGDFEVILVDLAQVFMTMDEASATEVAGVLMELIALHKAGDPMLRSIEDADDMAEGALMITAFRLSQLNPAAAMELLKSLPGSVPDEAYKLAFARMASQNLPQAEAMLAGLNEERRGDALEGILHAVASKDPAAALALAEKYPEVAGENEYRRIIERMMKRDPQQGIAAAVKLAENGKGTETLRNAMAAWVQRDQNAAMAWAEKHTGAGNAAVQAYLLEQRVEADPAAAVAEFTKLQQMATDQKELEHAAALIAQKLADKDISTAEAWATSLPPGPARDQALHHVVAQWVREDANGASAWITTLPQGKERDNATDTLVDAIKKRDPAAAFEWARNMQHEDRRFACIESVMREWREQDPDAAKAAAETLPESVRKKLPGE